MTGMEGILARIGRLTGVPDLADLLSERLPASDQHSLFLELARRRAERRAPAELLRQRRRDRTVAPAVADPRALTELTVAAFETAADYDAVELAPVEPAGLNTVLGGVDQHNVLATARGTEVVSDPTSALAVEAALRRADGEQLVRLCACHRVLRLQPFGGPGLYQHFRLFGMVTAGRSQPGNAFEVRALAEHVAAYLALYRRVHPRGEAVVRLSDSLLHRHLGEMGVEPVADVERPADAVPAAHRAAIGKRFLRLERATQAVAPLAQRFGDVRVLVDLSREHAVHYYEGLQLRLDLAVDGTLENAADGGSVDWMGRLLSDRREALFTSGIALERLLIR